jgi:hypothetical protein
VAVALALGVPGTGHGAELDADIATTTATPVAGKVLTRLQGIEASLLTTRYQHSTRVRRSEGLYAWDCSGMANWILRRDAPRAYAALDRERPVARSYFQAIERAPTHRARRGWQRIADIRDVRPGDVLAWTRPSYWPKGGNTGHVGFVVGAPQPVTEGRYAEHGAFTVRVVDATSLPHDDDTRDDEGEGGFGFGTLMFVTDASGRAFAYGWFGTRSRGVIPTDITFGRVSR